MERRRHDLSLAYQNGMAVAFGQDLYILSDLFDAWSANKDHLQGVSAELRRRSQDRAINLAAVGIALHRDVERADTHLRWIGHLLGEQDRACAGAERRLFQD